MDGFILTSCNFGFIPFSKNPTSVHLYINDRWMDGWVGRGGWMGRDGMGG